MKITVETHVLLGASFVCGATSVAFGVLYYALYWRYRGLFNEDGRYLDTHDLVMHHAQNAVLIVPAGAFALLALLLLAARWLHRVPGRKDP